MEDRKLKTKNMKQKMSNRSQKIKNGKERKQEIIQKVKNDRQNIEDRKHLEEEYREDKKDCRR